MVINNEVFREMVNAATMAPSSDNMQPWEFINYGTCIEVRCVKERLLKIDVMDMFSWISIGAAIENIVNYSAKIGLNAIVEYNSDPYKIWAARITFKEDKNIEHFADVIESRTTNRSKFSNNKIGDHIFNKLSKSISNLSCGVSWTNDDVKQGQISQIDEIFSAILLEHAPLFDGFFDTLLFTKKDIENIRVGMDIKSLDIPFLFAFIAKRLKGLKLNRIISRLGMGRFIARTLSSRLKQCGGIIYITAREQSPVGFLEVGRAFERIWLAVTKKDLSAHPYGVIPQYLTMSKIKPESFLDKHIPVIEECRKKFSNIFPEVKGEYPGVMLRIGYTTKISIRTTIRLWPDQVIKRNSQ